LQGSFHRNEIELQAEQIISSFLNGYLLKYYGLDLVMFLKTDAHLPLEMKLFKHMVPETETEHN